MSKQTACPEQCRDCKWHVRITGLVRGGLHRCMYENLKCGHPWMSVCEETVRKHGGMCLWYKKEANDD